MGTLGLVLIKHTINRSCLRKQNLSKERANRIVDKFIKKGELLYFYKCDFCGSYHMTKSPPRPPKRDFSIV